MQKNNSPYIVEMKNITKTFPGTKALDKVSLRLRKGEIHALVGENGAGKSTLMNVLTGQFFCDSGDLYVEGEPVRFSSPKEAMKKSIILVPQELNLVMEASVAENIFLGNEKVSGIWIDWKKVQKEAKKLLELLSVEIDVTRPVKELSAAYQQLVSIARALAYRPKVLILDEPTAVLTNKEATSLFVCMQELKKKETAMVFISHHLDEVMEQCDRITIMKDGCLVKEVSVEEITKDQMINLMAGKKVEKSQRIQREVSDEIFMKVHNLSRKGEFDKISFHVNKGEILCVSGLVGAGRTEIFKCIFGITEKEPGGKIYIEGQEAEIKSPIEAIAYGMGYVSEERRHDGIVPDLSVMENLVLPSLGNMKKAGLLDWKKAADVTDRYVQSFQIKTASRETRIKNLSGGNQQKVIVARWMAKGIKMLILDEPTRGIDVNAKGEIHQLIRDLADNGVAVIVISSEMEEVLALADRIMVVHKGMISGYLEDVDIATQEDVLKVAFQ
ncbi:sugar ABC transporter ATP-binding protein [Suipraeoptans intestinalis]|uniref:sugar ABC transporter ATP-binding protein n=2 Tax=Lachnospiraceae TaxID=186803 RepID=UPI002A760E45|nr:sugar ABC transporter ATP-binding protein [Suipraeoptans intestinalis]MDY3121976.1 sugar ABC transporter ATP-binding protein [Suipraeoptans intestinalis]